VVGTKPGTVDLQMTISGGGQTRFQGNDSLSHLQRLLGFQQSDTLFLNCLNLWLTGRENESSDAHFKMGIADQRGSQQQRQQSEQR
jgi:hypothetical protein